MNDAAFQENCHQPS